MKYIPIYIAVFLLTLFLLGFAACSISTSDTEDVIVFLPDFPKQVTPESSAESPALSRWLIQIESKDISKSYYVEPEASGNENDSTESQISFSLTLPLNQPAAITAYPITLISDTKEETQFFKPAGSIYPYGWENGTLKLTWENGFTASIMQTIFRSSIETGLSKDHINEYISCINWKKISNTIHEYTQKSLNTFTDEKNSNTKFYNPWQIDRQLLLENFTTGIFSADYLKTKYILAVNDSLLNLPENTYILSSYIPENQLIQNYHILTLKKNCEENLMLIDAKSSNKSLPSNYNLKLICTSAKKVSLEVLYLPIFIDEYEY